MDLAELHPILVHAPLVLLPAAVGLRLAHAVFPRAGLRLAAILLLLAGVGFGLLAKESGEAAEHQAEQAARSVKVEDIQVAGSIPQLVADGSLLETHASLAENTVLIFGLLLAAEAALLFLSHPAFARWRGTFSLSLPVQRIAGGIWIVLAVASLALVVLTGFYGGKLVYEHGVGVAQTASQP
jgi:uncharacterized membrane protein